MTGSAIPLVPTVANPVPLVVDRLEPFSAAEAQALVAACPTIAAFGQYLDNLTAAAVAAIHATGRGILLFIEGRTTGLSSQLGTDVAQANCARAMALGVPQGVSIVIDQEDQHLDGGALDPMGALAYAIACATVIPRYGYAPAVYYGAPQALSASQLYSQPAWPYMQGGSIGLGHYEPDCGPALYQLRPLDRKIAGCVVDVSAATIDGKGRTFTVWGPPPPNERPTQPEGLPDPPDAPDSPGP